MANNSPEIPGNQAYRLLSQPELTTFGFLQIGSQTLHTATSKTWTLSLVATTCVLHTGNIIRNHKLSNQKRRDPPRKLYDYKNTTTTHWNLFTDNTRTLFSQDLEFQRALLAPAPSQRSMDVVWSRFQFNTNLAAEILPHKMSTNITLPKPKRLISLKPRGLLKDSNTLRKIIQQVALSNSLFHFNFEVEDWNKQIVDINVRLDLDIPPIIYPPDATWAITANIHLNSIKRLITLEEQHIRDIAIKERLIARAEDTITNQSRMLASLLNRDFKSIRVDRLVVIENNKPVLYTHPDDIQRLAPLQYQALLQPRQHNFANIPEQWIPIYSSLDRINPDIYKDLTDPPTLDEWQRALNKCSLHQLQACLELATDTSRNYIRMFMKISGSGQGKYSHRALFLRIGKRRNCFLFPNRPIGITN